MWFNTDIFKKRIVSFIVNRVVKKFIKVITFRNNNYLNEYQIFILLSLFITLWPLIPTGNFFNNWLSAIYYLPTGFILHEIKNKLLYL